MISKFSFNETIKRVFTCVTSGQILYRHILKDYISDVKIINEAKKKEGNTSKSLIKNINDSSQNLCNTNNIVSKTNNSIHPILAVNNSFLYLNSSLNSVNLEKVEGLIFECRWKKKYIILLKIVKVNDSEKFFKSIDIECLEMNHYEKAFNLKIRFYWDSFELKTNLLLQYIPKDKIIEEIILREFSQEDKNKIYNILNDYLINDLNNLENCLTTLVLANMKEVSLYLRDINNVLRFAAGMNNKRFEFYQSPLINTVKNCRVYDNQTNKLWQEYVFTGYFVDKKIACQMRWEKKENNKLFCIYRISIFYLEENICLLIFQNIFQKHVTTQYLSDINSRKKLFFNELRNYFNKKHAQFGYQYFEPKMTDLNLMIAIKANKDENEDNNDLNLFINNNNKSVDKFIEPKKEENENDKMNSLAQTISFNANEIKEEDNLFGESIQNISEIKNNNSTLLFGADDENLKIK